jgi:phage baseplate assembly protein V
MFSDRERPSDHAQVDNGIVIGKVVSQEITDSQVCVRVLFPDRNNLISKPIPVLQRRTRGMRSMDCPAVGTNVKVSRLSNGLEEMFVDGEFYTTENPPPQLDPNKSYTDFPDGSIIQFDHGGGGLILNLKSPAILETTATINLKATGDIVLESAGNITLRAGGEIIFETGGGPRIRILPTGDMLQPDGFHEDNIGKHVA